MHPCGWFDSDGKTSWSSSVSRQCGQEGGADCGRGAGHPQTKPPFCRWHVPPRTNDSCDVTAVCEHAGDETRAREPLHATLGVRMIEYLKMHLRDPDLTSVASPANMASPSATPTSSCRAPASPSPTGCAPSAWPAPPATSRRPPIPTTPSPPSPTAGASPTKPTSPAPSAASTASAHANTAEHNDARCCKRAYPNIAANSASRSLLPL